MEKEKFCDLVFILDASGSMQPLTADTVGGFNEMLNKQKEAGLARVTTVAFANRAIVLHDGVSIMHVEPLTEKEYSPCGGTAPILSTPRRRGCATASVRCRQCSKTFANKKDRLGISPSGFLYRKNGPPRGFSPPCGVFRRKTRQKAPAALPHENAWKAKAAARIYV